MVDSEQKILDTELAAEADMPTGVADAEVDGSLVQDLTTELQIPSNDESISTKTETGSVADEAKQKPGSSSNPTPDLTSHTQENQPERPAAAAKPPRQQAAATAAVSDYDKFPATLKPRIANVDEQLEAKERLVLSYIYTKVPKPFYDRWKQESNDIFCLRVRLKYRSRGF